MARKKTLDSPNQMTLWQAVTKVYVEAGDREIDNQTLYREACAKAGLDLEAFTHTQPIGTKGARASVMARSARWCQQTLRQRGLVEVVPGQRGVWRLTREAKTELHHIERGYVMLGFSTRLGLAVVGDCRDAGALIDRPVHLYLVSPPYLLADNRGRAYGGPASHDYVDFICSAIEPVLPKLARGASLCLNVGTDCFEKNSPARRIVTERLVVALNDRFGLQLMDRLIWRSNKAPGPVQWASKTRQQLSGTYEPILWMALDPLHCFADNRRVLQPHTEKHARLIAAGGETRAAVNSDGKHRIRVGSYGASTPGRIPRNVLDIGTTCAGQRAYKRDAAALGLPVHGAPFCEALVDFLIRFLTTPGMHVLDNMAGSQTTGVVAERLGREWTSIDRCPAYVRGGATRFPGAWINPDLDAVLGLRQSGCTAESLA